MEEIFGGIYQGHKIFTTKEDIDNIFGDIVNFGKSITDDQFSDILERCDNNGWKMWKSVWQYWKSEGILN